MGNLYLWLKLRMKPNFEVELLPEAIEFLDALDDNQERKFITTSGNLNW